MNIRCIFDSNPYLSELQSLILYCPYGLVARKKHVRFEKDNFLCFPMCKKDTQGLGETFLLMFLPSFIVYGDISKICTIEQSKTDFVFPYMVKKHF